MKPIIRLSATAPDTIVSKASEDGNCSTLSPLILDGVTYLPARVSRLGADGKDAQSPEVGMFMMKIDAEFGVYMRLTPRMLREIGGAMIATANQIDLHASIQAAAALKKAAPKGHST